MLEIIAAGAMLEDNTFRNKTYQAEREEIRSCGTPLWAKVPTRDRDALPVACRRASSSGKLRVCLFLGCHAW